MGWKSTIDITREEAIRIIQSADLEELPNDILSEVVEYVLGGEDHGANYRIID